MGIIITMAVIAIILVWLNVTSNEDDRMDRIVSGFLICMVIALLTTAVYIYHKQSESMVNHKYEQVIITKQDTLWRRIN